MTPQVYYSANYNRRQPHHVRLCVMLLMIRIVALYGNNSIIDCRYPTTTITQTTTSSIQTPVVTVDAFGYYYHHHYHHHRSATFIEGYNNNGGDSRSNNKCLNKNRFSNQHPSFRKRRRRTNALFKTIVVGMMIHEDNHSYDDSNAQSSSRMEQHVRRKIPARKPHFFVHQTTPSAVASRTLFHRATLHMFSKRSSGTADASSSSTSTSRIITDMSVRSSSISSTASRAVAPSTSIPQQISNLVGTVTTTDVGDETRQLESIEAGILKQEGVSSSTTTPSSSVHLQRTDPTLIRKNKSETDMEVPPPPEDDSSQNETPSTTTTATTPSKPTFGTTVVVHSYNDTTTNQTWKALNISRRKFRSYLQYCQVWNHNYTGSGNGTTMTTIASELSRNSSSSSIDDYTGIETVQHTILTTSSKSKPITIASEEINDTASVDGGSETQELWIKKEELRNVTSQLRDEWRTLWRVGRLITDRTELLAVYPSDLKPEIISNDSDQHGANEAIQQPSATTTNEDQDADESKLIRKRGGFADLLLLYTDRLLAMLRDEHDDTVNITSSVETPSIDIVQWLERSYGRSETYDLRYENFQTFNESTKLMKLKHFLEWFRSQFPYFYDRCDTCGASIKEDLAKIAAATSDTDATAALDEAMKKSAEDDVDDINLSQENCTSLVNKNELEMDDTIEDESDGATSDDDEDSEHQTFAGYVYPNHTELIGKASRTELYQCHQCSSFTRFPRYNAAQFVMSQQRGRCGEYSMLLYRILRALHHECRWVVDWADHLWVELLLQSSDHTAVATSPRWIHLDPCEAAVNENLIYQGWGKKQNYILGFYLPPIRNVEVSLKDLSDYVRKQKMTNSTYTTASNISYIEDVTRYYTNEDWGDVCQRRDESESYINASIIKATIELQHKLLEYYNYTASAPSNETVTRSR